MSPRTHANELHRKLAVVQFGVRNLFSISFLYAAGFDPPTE